MKLIGLELRKNKISGYLLASLLIFIACGGIGCLPLFMSELAMGLPVPQAASMEQFRGWKGLTALITLLHASMFAILSAVMHTKFTVEEYVGKRAVLLFSYPRSRSRILFVKCSLVFFYTVLATVLSSLITMLCYGLVSNLSGAIPQPFTASVLPTLLTRAGICGLLAGAVGLVSLRIGFWKKSMIATVVTSVILIAPFGNMMTFFSDRSAGILLGGMGILLTAGLIIFAELMCKVNKMEA